MEDLKNGKGKKKILFGGVTVLSLAAIAGIGYASWVIANNVGDTSDNLDIQIGAISSSSMNVNTTNQDTVVRFDALANEACTNGITNGDGEVEDLEYSVTFTLTSSGSLNGVTLDFTYDGTSDFISALDGNPQYIDTTCLTDCTYTLAGYGVSGATLTGNDAGTITVTYTDTSAYTTANITVAFKFAWGSAFGGVNPCVSTVDNVADVLEAFNTAFNTVSGSTISLTIAAEAE